MVPVSATIEAPSAPVPAATTDNPGAKDVVADSATVDPTPRCAPFDWSPRALTPLLRPGKRQTPGHADAPHVDAGAFDDRCSDDPPGMRREHDAKSVVVSGVELRLDTTTPAGSSGRGWPGDACTFDARLADGSGRSVHLGPEVVPPFNHIGAVIRSGSAAWIELSYNGYTKEFPKGGNRIVAVDLCDGRVVWRSKDSMSSFGGLLLLGDYLVSAFGFTLEPRFVSVLDARSGKVIQRLSVLENICPSPPCDAPGQRVGAASRPRVEDGRFLVDTNTGASSFEFL
jgi:hypothetical protein